MQYSVRVIVNANMSVYNSTCNAIQYACVYEPSPDMTKGEVRSINRLFNTQNNDDKKEAIKPVIIANCGFAILLLCVSLSLGREKYINNIPMITINPNPISSIL